MLTRAGGLRLCVLNDVGSGIPHYRGAVRYLRSVRSGMRLALDLRAIMDLVMSPRTTEASLSNDEQHRVDDGDAGGMSFDRETDACGTAGRQQMHGSPRA